MLKTLVLGCPIFSTFKDIKYFAWNIITGNGEINEENFYFYDQYQYSNQSEQSFEMVKNWKFSISFILISFIQFLKIFFWSTWPTSQSLYSCLWPLLYDMFSEYLSYLSFSPYKCPYFNPHFSWSCKTNAHCQLKGNWSSWSL